MWMELWSTVDRIDSHDPAARGAVGVLFLHDILDPDGRRATGNELCPAGTAVI